MDAVNSHKDLIAWRKSMELVVLVYGVSKDFPPEEKYGLTNQVRRASVSIPSNIAEGRLRGTRNDYARFVSMALGSSAELETQIEIARRLGYLTWQESAKIRALLIEVMKMLKVLRSRLKP